MTWKHRVEIYQFCRRYDNYESSKQLENMDSAKALKICTSFTKRKKWHITTDSKFRLKVLLEIVAIALIKTNFHFGKLEGLQNLSYPLIYPILYSMKSNQ